MVHMQKGEKMNIAGIIGFVNFWGLLVVVILMGGMPSIFVNAPSAIPLA